MFFTVRLFCNFLGRTFRSTLSDHQQPTAWFTRLRCPAGRNSFSIFIIAIVNEIYVRRRNCLFAALVCVTNYRMILCLRRRSHKTRLTQLIVCRSTPPDNNLHKHSSGIANQQLTRTSASGKLVESRNYLVFAVFLVTTKLSSLRPFTDSHSDKATNFSRLQLAVGSEFRKIFFFFVTQKTLKYFFARVNVFFS